MGVQGLGLRALGFYFFHARASEFRLLGRLRLGGLSKSLLIK